MKNMIIVLIITLLSQACSNINKTIKVAYIKKSILSKVDSFQFDVVYSTHKEGYDIIFFEKLKLKEAQRLIEVLPDYEFYLGKPENGKNGTTIQPIAYKKENYTIQTQAYLELNYPVQLFQDGTTGHIVAVKLRENRSGRTLFALNAATSESHLNEQIYNIHKIIKSYTDNLPTILAGDFPNNDENLKLLTGNWYNMVKLEGASTFSYLNRESQSDDQNIFVNGFLSIDKNRRGRITNSFMATNYTISFNKNYKDVRTKSQPYPMPQPPPYFEQNQIVFNEIQTVRISNPNAQAYVVYSTDESEPSLHSPIYQHPITIHETCRVKMRSLQKESEFGAIVCRHFIKTGLTNYHVEEISSHPPRDWIFPKGFQFLTDQLKGSESRTHASWLPIEPNQTVTITMKLKEPTQLRHIYLSFSTPGRIKLPEIELAVINGDNELLVYDDLNISLLGGAQSQCGTEGWLTLTTPLQAKELVMNLKLDPNDTTPLYIDEIVLQ